MGFLRATPGILRSSWRPAAWSPRARTVSPSRALPQTAPLKVPVTSLKLTDESWSMRRPCDWLPGELGKRNERPEAGELPGSTPGRISGQIRTPGSPASCTPWQASWMPALSAEIKPTRDSAQKRWLKAFAWKWLRVVISEQTYLTYNPGIEHPIGRDLVLLIRSHDGVPEFIQPLDAPFGSSIERGTAKLNTLKSENHQNLVLSAI